ncbi:sigma-70 region 4 domain-containing protein [uncultured Oscillibacter sp.]|uniref:sigma-70 region 4 domain-containing protein n=1 Tax=uncultured Oscillibacter sp. TaxID=876091 RepID=UPI00345AD947
MGGDYSRPFLKFTLPNKERRVILYDFCYDLKDKEISEKLAVTVRTVYNLRQRAFKKIRTYYE